MSADDVIVRRFIPVPPKAVFAAWLDPASLVQWMRPGGTSKATAEVDPRVGGAFRIVMEHDAFRQEHWGEYLAIEPPTRLQFTWISASTDNQATTVTVELTERDQGTDLVLTHRRLPPAQTENHRKGWTEIVQYLAEYLGASHGTM